MLFLQGNTCLSTRTQSLSEVQRESDLLKRQKKEREKRGRRREKKQKKVREVIFNSLCEKLCKSGARGGCWPWLGEALGGCSPPLGGSMGCMQPHTSDDWVSPGYPPPMMLLDTDISTASSCKCATSAYVPNHAIVATVPMQCSHTVLEVCT